MIYGSIITNFTVRANGHLMQTKGFFSPFSFSNCFLHSSGLLKCFNFIVNLYVKHIFSHYMVWISWVDFSKLVLMSFYMQNYYAMPLSCRGVQLVERNEEVCIFYEKFNIQGKWDLKGRSIEWFRCRINIWSVS